MRFIKHILILILGLQSTIDAQNNARFVIEFTDKNGSSYNTSAPSAFLSAQAINRRNKQNITIKQNDLPVNKWYIDSVAKTGVKILNVSKWLNAIAIDTVGFPNALNKILSYPFVKSMLPVGIAIQNGNSSILKTKAENKFDLETIDLASTDLNYGNSLNQTNMIGADCLHNKGFKGEGMVIAVIDAGFFNADTLPVFDSLFMNNQILGTVDFANKGNNVFKENPHGMQVLSTMGGNLPGKLVGTAPKAKYWLLRSEVAATENKIEEFNLVAALEFADSVGVDMVNTSLGYNTFDNASQNYTYQDMDGKTAISTRGVTIAASKGIIVVSSAGNSGNSGWKYITAPADADSILTVGAVNANGNLASFSSRGPTFDKRLKPNVVAQGQSAIFASVSGGITSGNGTSFSSPIMAGAVACLWQAYPNKTNMEIIDAVQRSASNNLNPDTLLGYGIPNLCTADMLLSGIISSIPADDQLMKAYPNPFTNELNILLYSKKAQNITTQVYDVRGRKIIEQQHSATNNTVDKYKIYGTDGLDAGLYFLNIITPQAVYTQKIIKR